MDLLTSGALPDVQPQDVEDSSTQPESSQKTGSHNNDHGHWGADRSDTAESEHQPFYSFRGQGGCQTQMLQLLTDLQKSIVAS